MPSPVQVGDLHSKIMQSKKTGVSRIVWVFKDEDGREHHVFQQCSQCSRASHSRNFGIKNWKTVRPILFRVLP